MTNLLENNSLSSNSDVRLVALQLQKDFMMFGEDMEVESIQSFSQLEELINRVVCDLLQRNRTKLTQIIYRIDIPEEAISRAIEKENMDGFERIVSRLMIERTVLKIEIRKQNF